MVTNSGAESISSPIRAQYSYTVTQAASYLGVSVKTLYGIAARGEIDHLRTGQRRHSGVTPPDHSRRAGRIKTLTRGPGRVDRGASIAEDRLSRARDGRRSP